MCEIEEKTKATIKYTKKMQKGKWKGVELFFVLSSNINFYFTHFEREENSFLEHFYVL